MGRNAKRRERLLRRKVFKNDSEWDFEDLFRTINITMLLIAVSLIFLFLADGYRSNFPSGRDVDLVGRSIFFLFFYIFGLTLIVVIVCYKVPDKYFRLCSVLGILHITLILFLVFHPFLTFVPGPETDELVEMFEFVFYAAFIWIPLLIVSLLLCSIILWKASDQSELYTVILDGKRSSTKQMDP